LLYKSGIKDSKGTLRKVDEQITDLMTQVA